MAKIYGITGPLSGKMGTVVFSVKNGTQIVRQYQPIVANTKSASQQMQRAKLNLAGRISAITPSEILVGLAGSKAMRRARFLQLLMRKISSGYVAGSTTEINAKLVDSDFVFSEGSLVPLYSVANASSDFTTVNLSISRASGVTTEDAASQGLLVVLVLKQTSGGWEEVQYRFLMPEDLATSPTNVSFNHRAEGGVTASIYLAPFGTVDGSKLPTVSGELTSTPTSLDALLANNFSVSSLSWGRSFLAGETTYTPS